MKEECQNIIKLELTIKSFSTDIVCHSPVESHDFIDNVLNVLSLAGNLACAHTHLNIINNAGKGIMDFTYMFA